MPASGGIGWRSWPPTRPARRQPRHRRAAADPVRPRPGQWCSARTHASSSRWATTVSPSSTCCRSRTPSSAPVQPVKPLVFELPALTRAAPALLEGSSPQAKVAGRRVEIAGPFAPGNTIVQVALHVAVRRPRSWRSSSRCRCDLTARGGGGAEGRRDATELAADARTADDAGQRQRLHRRPRRRGAGRNQCCGSRSPGCRTTPPGRATSRSRSRSLILAGGAWSAVPRRGREHAATRSAPRARGRSRDRLFDELAALEESQPRGRHRIPMQLRRPPPRAGDGARTGLRRAGRRDRGRSRVLGATVSGTRQDR